jgi:hypothetical protein
MKYLGILIILLTAQQIIAQKKSEELTQKYHQFDFWLGTWEVYKNGTDTLVGHSQIESIIDGLGLLENYSVTKGSFQGKSLNKYNPARERWEQYWIDNSGLTLHLTGGLVDGKMVLEDVKTGNKGDGFNKIVWEKLPDGSVRQTWSVSQDGGLSWSVVFDGEYKARR